MNMKRKIAIKPAETLEIEVKDKNGDTIETIEAVFNVESLMVLTEEFEDPLKLSETFQNQPYEMAARILYSGIKVLNASVTLDYAKSLMVSGGIELLAEIMELFQANLGVVSQEELKKNLIPILNRKLRKQKPKTEPKQAKKFWPWVKVK